jgi:tetratricopeptide (TPR) repeat protein
MCHVSCVFAQESNQLVNLSKQIIEAKDNSQLYAPFAALKEVYYKDHRYADFVEYLKSLGGKKKSLQPFVEYYIAQARYLQLRHMEETQAWDEYFSHGNDYRDEITNNAASAIAATTASEPLNIYARLLLWQFHKHQEDSLRDSALEDLMRVASLYAQQAKDIALLKEVAGELLAYGEKAKSRELYKIYADKLISSDISNAQLRASADDFYQKGNLELAETLYDAYLGRLDKPQDKDELTAQLVSLAKAFSCKANAPSDPAYAEKIFRKLEEAGGKGIFDQELMYLRALNLEKAKDFIPAQDAYQKLLEVYPKSAHADEAEFKNGIFSVYVQRDLDKGKKSFEKLAAQEALSPQVISATYQLGLLAQWQEAFPRAKEYYQKLLERAKDNYQETVQLAKERLEEIAASKPIEYNLKTFLDVSLKDEYKTLDMSRLDLRSDPYQAAPDKNISVSSRPVVGESGCFQVETQYLWSGHLGTTRPGSEEAQFATKYLHRGTKEINLVAVTPAGILDRDLVMDDID